MSLKKEAPILIVQPIDEIELLGEEEEVVVILDKQEEVVVVEKEEEPLKKVEYSVQESDRIAILPEPPEPLEDETPERFFIPGLEKPEL